MIFESHAHYEDKRFDEDRDILLKQMKESGIDKIVNVGSNLETTKQTIALTEQYDFIYGAVGVHPSDIECLDEAAFAWLKDMTSGEKVVAVGEIGLDYYWDKEPKVQENQRYWFIRQLALAREESLPVIIHSRDAAADTLAIMKEHARDMQGVIHCFSYGKEMAEEYLKMGFYIGIGGVVTFKNAKKVKEVVEMCPLSRILLETDSPYLAPEPNRGKRNNSLNLIYVAEEIAKIKGISVEEVTEVTYRNAKELYF